MNSYRVTRWLRRLAIGVVVGGALGTFSFWLWVFPEASQLLGQGPSYVLARLLDTPVSALNICLPYFMRSGFAAQFISYTYCFPRSTEYELTRYLIVAIPAYLIVFNIPFTISFLVARLRLWFAHRHEAA